MNDLYCLQHLEKPPFKNPVGDGVAVLLLLQKIVFCSEFIVAVNVAERCFAQPPGRIYPEGIMIADSCFDLI